MLMQSISSLPKEIYMHQEFERAFNQCKRFAEFGEPGDLGVCVGPSGAGKTLLSTIIGDAVYGRRETWEKGTILYLRVVTTNPDRGFFSPKELTKDVLCELDDPFRIPNYKMANLGLPPELIAKINRADLPKLSTSSEPEMRSVIEGIGPHKKLDLIIVDEANMLALTYQNRPPTDYLEGLRLLGKRANCKVLLFGTVDLLLLGAYSAQLNRSEIRIHLNRMCCRDDTGKDEFCAFLGKQGEKWNVAPKALEGNIASVFDWTFGIPGEVDHLLKVATIRSGGSSEQLTWDDIKGCKPTVDEMDRIRTEAEIVESIMNNEPLTRPQISALKRRRRASKLKARRVYAGVQV